MFECVMVVVSCDYSFYGKLKFVVPEFEVKIVDEQFADDVRVTMLVKIEMSEKLNEKLVDLANGKINMEETTNLWADFA